MKQNNTTTKPITNNMKLYTEKQVINNKQSSVSYWITKIQQSGAVNRFNHAFDRYIGKKVEVNGKIGTYLAKHIDIPLHYVLLDGEDKPIVSHIFELHLNYKILNQNK